MDLRRWVTPRRFSAHARRERLGRRAPGGPLRDYLAVEFPAADTDVADLRLLAVDLETTGLKANVDHLLSIGFVPVNGLTIDLAGAGQVTVRADAEVGQSAVVHGVTDDVIAGGAELADAVGLLLGRLCGRVLLAHHAVIEEGFLSTACERLYGVPLVCVSVDTMQLQMRIQGGWGEEPAAGALRLDTARESFGLPRYRAHEALTDALACAELYLAQVAQLSGGGGYTLAQLSR
jgi:DNA polymerase-3 subunit epsilon